MTYYRVQLASRDAADLLDPGYQFSHAYNGNQRLTRAGVSACSSLEELAEYLVSGQAGALDVRHGNWVIIEMDADETGDGAVDEYEVLVRPTRILSVTPVGDEFFALMDERRLVVFGDDEPEDEED